jgi:transposase-like protein
MKKKDERKDDFQIPEEALRKIKSQTELDDFFHGLYKQAVEGMLKAANTIESLNSSIRKYTKTKTVFPDDQSALKAVYLAISNIQLKWTMTIRDWGMIINQFIIKFGDSCRI